jgi:hypothetical protein
MFLPPNRSRNSYNLKTSDILSCGSPAHLPANFCACSAGCCTLFTVFVTVFLTFLRARFTNCRAQLTHFSCKFAITGHQVRCKQADVSAIIVEFDAVGEVLDMRLIQAGVCAVFACGCTVVTSVYAGLVFFVAHKFRSLN